MIHLQCHHQCCNHDRFDGLELNGCIKKFIKVGNCNKVSLTFKIHATANFAKHVNASCPFSNSLNIEFEILDVFFFLFNLIMKKLEIDRLHLELFFWRRGFFYFLIFISFIWFFILFPLFLSGNVLFFPFSS